MQFLFIYLIEECLGLDVVSYLFFALLCQAVVPQAYKQILLR